MANKEYVDNTVAAASSNELGMPTMLSLKATSEKTQGQAAQYCNALNESGYDDWRLPTLEELSYAISAIRDTSGSLPTESQYLWTRTIATSEHFVNGQSYWLVLNPYNGAWYAYVYSTTRGVRCIR